MFRYFFMALFLIPLQSCFLFGKYKRTAFTFTRNDTAQTVRLLVPKGYSRSETRTDSSGNEVKFFYYGSGSFLYFAQMRDTSVAYQPVEYGLNIPRELYQTIYFKGIEEERYWRETRFRDFKSGYRGVKSGRDGVFDSAINYFTMQLLRN